MTMFEQACYDNQIDHAVLQRDDKTTCSGYLTGTIIYNYARIVGRHWECSECGILYTDYDLIKISDDIDGEHVINNYDYNRNYHDSCI